MQRAAPSINSASGDHAPHRIIVIGGGAGEVELAPYLDNEGGEVVGRRVFRYDTLIIAIGSHGNDFGTPGVREHAILLDTTDEAADRILPPLPKRLADKALKILKDLRVRVIPRRASKRLPRAA